MNSELNKIVFVILHYYTINDTIKCVDSIQANNNNNNYEIVIVDNASKNGTGEELQSKYEDIENIHVILNKENLGFANGNNVGYIYAKRELNADYIVLLNNDTVLLQNNFFQLIIKEFNNSKFAVLGPKILLPDNKINPIMERIPTLDIVKKQLFNIRIDLITNKLFINNLYKFIRHLIKLVLIKLKLKKNVEVIDEIDANKKYENIVLHGCFLIFSKKYIEKFDGLDDRTFLYREEELLALRLKKNNLKSVYNPEIQILHNEDGATNAITKNNRKKDIFVCKNLIKSTKILIRELEDEKMIKVKENTIIYVLCPAYSKTGGPELLHQLVNKLQSLKIDAYIVYTGIKQDDNNYTPEDFKAYNVKYIFEEQIEDKAENILIIPEIMVTKVNNFKNIRTAIWWLSVDNYKKNFMFIPAAKLCGLKYAVKLLIKGVTIFHRCDYKKAEYNLCQSYYAIDFLNKRNAKNIIYLSDYINRAFINENKDVLKKNKVLYNPKKGYKFTQKIIEKSPNFEWIPIKGLTTEQVKDLLLESKVYIDFGNHPGKDRFPREAAMCNCCVITGKKGAAKYYEDVKIPEEFKFVDVNKNIKNIIKKIDECINNYDLQMKKFTQYKDYIRNEEENFEKDILKVFEKEGE